MNAKNIESNELNRSLKTQPTLTKTLKVKVDVSKEKVEAFRELTARYKETANFVSKWVFENDFPINYAVISREIYYELRALFGLKSQLTQSTMRTVTGAYKTVQTQLARKPYRYKDENGVWQKIPRTLEWLQKPIQFKKPFADLVRNRDYSFVENGAYVSINTLSGRVRCTYDKSRVDEILAQGATLGGAKLLERRGKWYLHIAYEIPVPEELQAQEVAHVVGIDRGIRNLAVAYDERGKTTFFDGKAIRAKREQFARLREKLQKKNTKSTKRLLKRLEQRENRWMTDANHVLTRALVDRYGANTVFVLEDLEGGSFSEEILRKRTKSGKRQVRSWAFYQFEQFLEYKAREVGSKVLKVPASYTSQRCPRCGKIEKNQRDRDTHEYHCTCGFRSNDDRSAAINIQLLGTLWVSGESAPRFDKPKGIVGGEPVNK